MSLIGISTLGNIAIDGINGPELPARGKLIALLVYLTRRSNGGVRREELAALFWGDKPEALARQSLRHALMRLRRAVGDDVLIVTADDARIRPAAVELDVARFEAHLARGDLTAAVELWAGDFLDGFEDAGSEGWRVWLEAEREALRQRLGYALATLTDEAEARADWESASRWSELWCTALPLDERAQLRWIQALRFAGRPADARSAHARITHQLREDFGIEPSPALALIGDELARATHSRPFRPAAGAAALAVPDLVGRSNAFSALVTAWNVAHANEGAVVLLEGDEGIGRTRLLAEFVRWQNEQTARGLIMHARAYGPERDIPWSAARELLSGLRAAPGLSGAPDAALAELADLLPSIAERFRNLPPATRNTDARARAIGQVLADVAAELPVMLVFDDFTSADADSARLALALARRPPAGVLIVLAARTDCLDASGYGHELRGMTGIRRIRLEPLGSTDVETVIASMLDMAAEARSTLTARICAETAGNPHFVVELISTLADAGHIVVGASGKWELAPRFHDLPLPLPETVRSSVHQRTTQLPDAPKRVLEAAAALGKSAPIDRVAAVSGIGGDDLDAAVRELVARKLMRPAGTAAGIEFTHEIVRRAVHEDIAPARRQRYEKLLAGSAPRARRRYSAIAAAAIIVFTSAGLLAFLRKPAAELPVLAVGEIIDETHGDSTGARFPLRDLLATRLATLPHLPVISPERMHEVRAQLSDVAAADRTLAAARRAGAREIMQGTLLRGRNGELRLELRRVSLRNGAVTGAYSISGADPLDLVDAATAEIAGRFGIPVQRGQPGIPASLVAYRLYEEGLRAYYQGDGPAAHRFFSAAVEEDSTFAMAAFYDWAAKSMGGLLRDESEAQLARVVRLAQHAPPRESLLIRALWASHNHAPERLALAETLAIRYPHEPEGHLLMGRAKHAAGDFVGSIPHFRKVLTMDTASGRAAGLPCRACDALAGMTNAYSLADSLPAAERSARAWTQLQPSAARAWVYLATTVEYQSRFAEALTTRRNAAALRPGDRVDVVYPARVELRQGNYERGDAMLRQRIAEGPTSVAREASWYLIMSLRQQGRLAEALRVARDRDDSLSVAVVQLERGEARQAARYFGREAPSSISDSLVPRYNSRMWRLAHAATTHAAYGDTAAVRAIADTLRALAPRTSAARNRKLQYYALGLLHATRGDHQTAARLFERSVHSLTNGYGRINLELARSYLALRQPAKAAAVLEPTLRGPLDAGNYYVTRTELRALLGTAYEAAGRRDAAVAEYRRVLAAWRNADPAFDARKAQIQTRLDALLRQNPQSRTLANS